jgi:hypothetical protein
VISLSGRSSDVVTIQRFASGMSHPLLPMAPARDPFRLSSVGRAVASRCPAASSTRGCREAPDWFPPRVPRSQPHAVWPCSFHSSSRSASVVALPKRRRVRVPRFRSYRSSRTTTVRAASDPAKPPT